MSKFVNLFRGKGNVGKDVMVSYDYGVTDKGYLKIPVACITSVLEFGRDEVIVGTQNSATGEFSGYLHFNGSITVRDNVDGQEPWQIEDIGMGGRSSAEHIKNAIDRNKKIGQAAYTVISAKNMGSSSAPVELTVHQTQGAPGSQRGFHEYTIDDVLKIVAISQGTTAEARVIRRGQNPADQVAAMIIQAQQHGFDGQERRL